MNLVPREQNEDQEAFLPKAHKAIPLSENGPPELIPALKAHLRLVIEIFMAFLILVLLAHPPGRQMTKPSAVPTFPLRTYTFVQNPGYLHEGMFANKEETLHTLHNWIELSSVGRGFAKINDSGAFGLGEPYRTNSNSGEDEPVYMVSVFHQLHCLSYLVQALQTASQDGGLEQEVAHHSAHCFNYIRQSIMCNADTSTEGKTEAGPGWGSKHECKDYDALLTWANEHAVYRWKNSLLPDESVL